MMADNRVEICYPKEAVLNIFTAPNRYLKDSYARVFLNEVTALARDKDLSHTDFRVFMSIIGHLDYKNIVNVSQKDLGIELNIKQPNVAKSIKNLINKGYLEVIDTIGRQNVYMVNPNVVFRTRAKNLKELKHAWDKQIVPNTEKYPIDVDTDLEPDLEDKLDDKVSQLSKQFDLPASKVRQMILSLVNQALSSEDEELELPY